MNIDIHNKFEIEVVDSKTNKVKEKATAYNTICNNLFTRLCSPYMDYSRYIHYGRGTGTPSSSDTKLFSMIAAVFVNKENDTHVDKCNEGLVSITRKIVISETQSVGETITEVGLAYSNSADSLCTHAMLQDMNGNQISITKTDTDVINIYATIYLHWNPQDDILLFSGYGTTSGYNGARYASSPLYDRFLGTGEGQPDESYAGGEFGRLWCLNLRLNGTTYKDFAPWIFRDNGNKSFKTITYDATNKKIDVKIQRFGVDTANEGGIGRFILSFTSSTYGYYGDSYFCNGGQGIWLVICSGGESLPPCEIKNESIGAGDGTTTQFPVKFNFPHDVKIYFNGEEKSGGYEVVSGPIYTDTTKLVNFMDFRDRNYPHRIVRARIDNNTTYLYTSYVYYNYAYDIGIGEIYGNGTLLGSNDGEQWDTIITSTGNTWSPIPSDKQHYKYLKSVNGDLQYRWNAWNGKSIRFDTPPAEGTVITASYTTDFVAKDADHVFDLSLTFQFGEYIE